nr:c-x8-c-x5-c-x3-h type zinc finger protein [Colletotrichum truncatum]KAF6801523.1 c-x8-c-x5-c-x3-h type zinc finger protein [Colletotrichum truncatum]
MQNWQTNGQAGSAQGHNNNIWPGSYGFSNGSTQYGATQDWTQQIHNQNAFTHLAPQGNGAEDSPFGSSPHQGHAAVATDHNGMSALSQTNFPNGHSHFGLDSSYADPGQDDPLAGLHDFPQDMYGQQGKTDYNGNIESLNHSHTPDFSNQQFQYNGQANQLFNGSVTQFNEPQLMPQHSHQNSAQLQQQQQRFDSIPQNYSPAPQGYVQSPQQHQAQPERVFSQSPHSFQAQHAHQQNNQTFSNQTPPPYQPNQAPPYQQNKLMPQQVPYAQPGAPAFQPVAPKQMAEQARTPQPAVQPQPQPVHQAKAISNAARSIQPQPQPQPLQQHQHQQQQQQQQYHQQQLQLQHQQPQHQLPPLQPHHQPIAAAPAVQPDTPPVDPAALPDQVSAKKRKRVIKKEAEPEQADSPSESTVRRGDDGENLIFPSSTEEEIAAMAHFKKRNAAAKKQFPAIPGASFLVSSGTAKLPAPKSYDRLAPLVALPSSSGKRILPELVSDLPCEIQGKFTDKYRPSANFAGKPEDRETEARALLDQYTHEMKLLGNRRPKYADYPFTFQEQLKADEAAKSKAQRKARKEEEEERKKPIRPETRPVDPVEGAVWDILGIVYIDPAATRTNALIASAVQALGEFLIKLRSEMNRAKQEADQAAKEGKPAPVIAEWTRKTDLKKETFTKVCEAAAKHGDEAVLENLGGHQKGILSLVNMLIGCIKAADFNGPLPKALLRFMSNISMSKKVAENVNFENIRKRLADKGDDEVKELVRTIASRIKKETDSNNGVEVKKPSSTASVSKVTKPPSKAVEGSPAKRARDDESDSRAVKKVAVESTSSTLSSKLGAKPAAGSLQSKFGASKPRPNPATTLAGKIRPPKPITKEPTKPEASKPEVPPSTTTPMDVDKKPTTTVPKVEAKVTVTKPAAASGSSLSSIASLLDSINTPKAESQTAQSKDSSKKDSAETPEEKAKRLRKEARRKLRVTWKPETELVQVRIFHKEAAEDEDNMTRDAADDRSEGMMLKQRANFNEDEDDDDELPYQPWVPPVLADLSSIDHDYREKSYVTRGGNVAFRTDEQKAIEDREKKELMVIYTDASDIPPTPKSPPPEPAVPNSDAKIVQFPQGELKYDEIHKRWKETQQFGWEAAVYYARKRLDAKDDPATKLNSILGNLKPVAPAVTPEPYNMTPPGENAQPIILPATEMQAVPAIPFDDKVHSILTSDKMTNWRDTNPFNAAAPQTQRRFDYPDANTQAAANMIEEVVEKLRGLPYPATSPPAWLADDPERVREWWAGFQKDTAAKAKKEADDRARTEAEAGTQQAAPQAQDGQEAWAAYYQQQQQYAQYMALMQSMQGTQAPQPAQPAPAPTAQGTQLGDAQLQAILAQMGQQQQPALAVPQGGAFGLNTQDAGYQQLMMLAQMQQQHQQPQQHQQSPPVEQPPIENASENTYNKPPPGRKLIDYSDRDTREDLDQSRGRDRDREREGRGKQGKNRKGNAPGGATLAPHRPVNRALIGTKPCSFWQQGKCARGDKCTFRHDI